MAGIFMDLWDTEDEENIHGYGQYLFTNCVDSGYCYQDNNEFLLSQLWLGSSSAIGFSINNDIAERDGIMTSSTSEIYVYLYEGVLPLPSYQYNAEGFWFSSYGQFYEPNFNTDNFGSVRIATESGACDTGVLWGYWEAGTYDAGIESYGDNYLYNNESNFHYLIIEEPTDLAMLDTLSAMGSKEYALIDSNFSINSADNSTVLAMTNGIINVDFTEQTFGLNLGFEDGSTLQALQNDVLDLFNANAIDLAGTGALSAGQLTGQFFGPEAEGIAAIIEAILAENDELLRGIGIFTREP